MTLLALTALKRTFRIIRNVAREMSNETLCKNTGPITFSSHVNTPWCLRFLACLSLGFRGSEQSASGHITRGSSLPGRSQWPSIQKSSLVHHGAAARKYGRRRNELNSWCRSQRPYR